jgi:hypothetical protein
MVAPLLRLAQRQNSSIHRQKGSVFDVLNNPWVTFFAAAFTTLTLTKWDVWASVPSIIPAAALLLVYLALIPRTKENIHKSLSLLPTINIGNDIAPLSLRVVWFLCCILGAEILFLGMPKATIGSILKLGLSKACSWHLTIRAVSCSPPLLKNGLVLTHEQAQAASWDLAAAAGTFSLTATRNPTALPSELLAISNVLASSFAVNQITYATPKHAARRALLWILLGFPVIPYVFNLIAIHRASSLAPASFAQGSQKHPVEALVQRARSDFEGLLSRQSQTYGAAVSEYRSRYGNDPPPGFEAWYNFAVKHDSPIIDDFDAMYASISPFWKVSGGNVVKAMEDVRRKPQNEVWSCSFSGAQAETSCTHDVRKYDRHITYLFNEQMADLAGAIPSVSFLVNHLDEPRVLFPPHDRGGSDANANIRLTHMGRRPIWDVITKFCNARKGSGHRESAQSVDTFGLPFVSSLPISMDLCHNPHYGDLHGFFMSPVSMQLVDGPVPILSTGAPSTMGDILFPSPAYIETEFQYDEQNDVDWDQKHNRLYWAGSTTGGFAQDDRWHNYHRQRFVEVAQNLGHKKHAYLREKTPGIITRALSSFLNGRLFDVAFTRIFFCERRLCRDQGAYFGTRSWAPKDEALRSRLVFDIDGNSISGRYYKLLASKSTPVKQTVFREWHDDRLMPWVHFVPVSQSLEELPELVFYLTSTETGQRLAKEIADSGRQWFSRAFRDVDRTIYLYRLLLELARLQDPARNPI